MNYELIIKIMKCSYIATEETKYFARKGVYI